MAVKQATRLMLDEGCTKWHDRRKEKRFFNKNGMTDPLRMAYDEGMALAYYGPKAMSPRFRNNPYPPGKRHDSFEQGVASAEKDAEVNYGKGM